MFIDDEPQNVPSLRTRHREKKWPVARLHCFPEIIPRTGGIAQNGAPSEPEHHVASFAIRQHVVFPAASIANRASPARTLFEGSLYHRQRPEGWGTRNQAPLPVPGTTDMAAASGGRPRARQTGAPRTATLRAARRVPFP